jgi:hypothetical protein
MPFKKGSEEAKAHMAKIRLKKGDARLKNIGKKPKPVSELKRTKEIEMDVPIFGQPELNVPAFMVVKNKDGTNLVNPLTKARNLASRRGRPSVKLLRKPVNAIIISDDGKPSGSQIKTTLKDINPSQRAKAEMIIEDINTYSKSNPKGMPTYSFSNKERGRPETLEKNIRINKERAKEAEKNKTEPKHHSSLRKKKKKDEDGKEPDEEPEEEEEDSDEGSGSESDEEKPKPRKKRKSKYEGLEKQKYERMKPLPKDATAEQKAERRKLVRRMSMARARARERAEGEAEGNGLGGKISAKDLKALHTSSYKKDKDKQVGDWELDESISKPTASVYVNKKTKQPIVVHRGTEPTLSDWANNLAYVAGHSKKTQRYKDSEKVQKDAEAKYGDTLTTAHSQGAIYSKLAQNKKGIIDVNPASMGEVAEEGTTIRSKTDPVSILAGVRNLFSKNKKNITTSGKANPLSAHSLDILDELGDTELGNGLLTESGKVLKHLVSHISDRAEPVDKRDYRQAKMLIDGIMKEKISGNGIMPMTMMGCGGVHHHYHIMPDGRKTSMEVMQGKGLEDLLRDLGKYVQPVADASQDRAMKEIRGNGIESMLRDLGRYVQPVADAGMDRAMKEIRGDGLEDLFRDAGRYIQPVADAGMDRAMKEIKGRGRKGGRFVKGSKEAKEYMASIRSRK